MKTTLHGGNCGDSCCLRVQNLSVRIGSDHILQDINLHIHCGELVALIGPTAPENPPFSRPFWVSGSMKV